MRQLASGSYAVIDVGSENLTQGRAGAVAPFAIRNAAIWRHIVPALVLLVDAGLGWLRRWGWLGGWWRRVVGSREGASSEKDGKSDDFSEVHVFCLGTRAEVC